MSIRFTASRLAQQPLEPLYLVRQGRTPQLVEGREHGSDVRVRLWDGSRRLQPLVHVVQQGLKTRELVFFDGCVQAC